MDLEDEALGIAIRKAQAQHQAELKVQPNSSGFSWGAVQPQKGTTRRQQMDSFAAKRTWAALN